MLGLGAWVLGSLVFVRVGSLVFVRVGCLGVWELGAGLGLGAWESKAWCLAAGTSLLRLLGCGCLAAVGAWNFFVKCWCSVFKTGVKCGKLVAPHRRTQPENQV